MSVNGLAGRVLVVDLAQRTAEASPLNMAMVERFGGGLGLCIGLARQYLDPSCDALGPSNTVVIGAGALVGTDAPASSRVYAVAKLPASGSVGWCGAGGMTFGCQLKNAGFDHVVLQGASPEPVYLLIENDRVEIRDASMLRGQGTGETCDFLIKTHAPAGVISIGTAGENLVSFSMAYLDGVSTLGRGGLGAVFGAKNLKAVVVRGSRGVGVADPGAYRALSGSLIERIRSYPHLESWQDLGLLASLPVVSPDVYRRMRIRRMACVSCPIGDKDVMVVPTGDGAHRYACTSSAVNLFMPLVYGMKDPAEASGCVALLDELGMDMFEFFGLLSWAQAAQNKGTDFACGAPVDVSSSESVRSWAYAVANRMGMGDVLAEGFRGIARAFGE
ncbi:MAG TPA: aldehyde ferredoxin oxidoreductase N-terminal domain-containing protein, partial [Deltaproteobacteria bacterium]|nr:aldehyde ferredoxin oxidoreductase N-terminal domain-containing protein [Deltaproteobacteria bacterium]